MTWALLSDHQEQVLKLQFESLLKLKLGEGEIPLTAEARDALSRLTAKMGIRMVCHKVRLHLEYTRCRDLSQSLVALDRE
jgi:hypothetical protein